MDVLWIIMGISMKSLPSTSDGEDRLRGNKSSSKFKPPLSKTKFLSSWLAYLIFIKTPPTYPIPWKTKKDKDEEKTIYEYYFIYLFIPKNIIIILSNW